jgi:hypothetical protein
MRTADLRTTPNVWEQVKGQANLEVAKNGYQDWSREKLFEKGNIINELELQRFYQLHN